MNNMNMMQMMNQFMLMQQQMMYRNNNGSNNYNQTKNNIQSNFNQPMFLYQMNPFQMNQNQISPKTMTQTPKQEQKPIKKQSKEEEEEIKKWVQSRKLNFPTEENKSKKQNKEKVKEKAGIELSKLELKLKSKLKLLNKIEKKFYPTPTQKKNFLPHTTPHFKYKQNPILNDLFKKEKIKELNILLQVFKYFEEEEIIN
jgi:hypothetical protein